MTSFQRFPIILQKLFEAHTNVFEHFKKNFKDYQRFPKTFKADLKMFRSYTNKYNYNNKQLLYTIINNYCTITIKIM